MIRRPRTRPPCGAAVWSQASGTRPSAPQMAGNRKAIDVYEVKLYDTGNSPDYYGTLVPRQSKTRAGGLRSDQE